MPPAVREDPYGAFNFVVLIPGVAEDPASPVAGFSEVSGLGVEVDVIEYRTGGEDITVRKLPGLVKYTNIVLKRGVVGDTRVFRWMRETVTGRVRRVDMSIILLDEARQPVMRWRVRRAWARKWTGPALGAKTSEVAIETLEIAHEGFELDE